MIVIADSSILIALSAIGELDLLRHRFGEIIVPDAVWKETVDDASEYPGAVNIRASSWIKVKAIQDSPLKDMLQRELDIGEAEVLELAIDLKADVVLLDEKEAREVAERLGLKPLGVIGILFWAKKKGLIKNLKATLDELKTKVSFWISPDLYTKILKEAGERE